jgi:ethanolamine ammonia-lyase small subunit
MSGIDPWSRFRAATPARIGLGRSGDGLPTKALLEFQQAHARARDAVHGVVDFVALYTALAGDHQTVRVRSTAPDRLSYLRRPDLGRKLDQASRDTLNKLERQPWDVVFIIADGLSTAVDRHAVPLLRAVMPKLTSWRIAPVILAEQARVALGDDIGGLLAAEQSVMLIGERPGLSVADSLGVYLTWQPRLRRTDAERNCLSNIHANGLSYDSAAEKLCWLLHEARRRQISGVTLKEDAGATLIAAPSV